MRTLPAPLFRDPIYDAPTDPVVIWNREEKQWWMLYTQRRSGNHCIGVSHIHGTAIGVASSADGYDWLYRGTLPGLDFECGHNTFWAPEIIRAQGKYHMFVSYITGIPTNWNYPRHIVHYTADNLWNWQFDRVLNLSSDRVIDACVYEVEPGLFRMWYKDERDDCHTYSSISRDLSNWENEGPAVTYNLHEGPNVFELGGRKWMITDEWNGLGVYETQDFVHWERSGVILKDGGRRAWDQTKGHHADIVVSGEEGYIFYFTHPYLDRTDRDPNAPNLDEDGIACIQAARLKVVNGKLCCDRDEEFEMKMMPQE